MTSGLGFWPMLYEGSATRRAVSVLFMSLTLSLPVLPDLHSDGVGLGALHAASLPAAAHWLELLPDHHREDQQQSGPGECLLLLYCTLYSSSLYYTRHSSSSCPPRPLTGQKHTEQSSLWLSGHRLALPLEFGCVELPTLLYNSE